jgi:hypothetical protein
LVASLPARDLLLSAKDLLVEAILLMLFDASGQTAHGDLRGGDGGVREGLAQKINSLRKVEIARGKLQRDCSTR